jgi:hypothetical protein
MKGASDMVLRVRNRVVRREASTSCAGTRRRRHGRGAVIIGVIAQDDAEPGPAQQPRVRFLPMERPCGTGAGTTNVRRPRAPSDLGAAEFGAVPVVDGVVGITTAPLTGGAGQMTEGLPSIGDADWAYTRAVAVRIAAPVNRPNDIFCISCSSVGRLLFRFLSERLLCANNI